MSWQPSRGSLAKAAKAPISPVPPSYMQAHHLRNFRSYRERGLEMSRLLISSWDIPGICDIRTMTHVVNAHMRRHDTFRSWFEHTEAITSCAGPSSANDIQFVAVEHGELTTQSQWRERLLATRVRWSGGACASRSFSVRTTSPSAWPLTTFTVTRCSSRGVCEIHLMYLALVSGGAPLRLAEPGSYDNYCNRQREHISGLTLDSPVMSK
ncbi:trehalose-2-sulfate acyltransferase papA2 domain protein [Mycobacterium ulcerans str. Harvey]|uniref:Trehalose-2-sulfate acyltransferase papA2 domain protein n=1 Tax=Mycobacterium ulcerans str. Harvey TaxID=1299332 RepID=A0ABN0R1V9_MYCUL|nr:trehalose-2-sulfate acyltransferase papA2 domain protein [Mycobacterium ulcerans str. Harvey]